MKIHNQNHKLLINALDLFNKGDYDKVKVICQQVLLKEPNSIDANHLLGVVFLQKQMFAEALGFINQALAGDKNNAQFLSNRSLVLSGLGRFEEAMIDVNKAITLDPLFAESFYNRSNILIKLERFKEALDSLDKFISLRSNHYIAMFVRANLLRKVKHLDLAMAAYKEVLKLKPDFIEAILNIGLLHADNGSLEESMTYFDRALSIRPDMYECYVNKGALFERMGKFEDAYQCFKKALSINPIAKDALLNAGIVSEKLGKLQESLDCYDRLLELDPKNLGAYFNRGYVNERLQRLDSSISDYNKAIELAPDHWDAYWNRALAILCKGDFEKGWLEYENRFKLKMAANFYSRDEVKKSLWNGDPQLIRQKVLLVRSEQGLGDTIQFCRYVKQLSNMGAKVILQVQGPLINLLNELDGVSKVIHESEPLPEFDYFCHLMSLPLLLQTKIDSIPNQIPYLSANPEKVQFWADRLGPKINKRVGLVWSGGFRADRPDLWLLNRRRNIELIKLLSLKTDGIEFHSLQKGELPEAELVVQYLQNWDGPQIHNQADHLEDFTDTAALIENLDLLISVDTSTAHLAGALGKPVWLMNRFDTCWRWFLERSDSPWYPTFRIFRQESPDDWGPVIKKIQQELQKFAKS